MPRAILRRLLVIPVALWVANIAGFFYAYVARAVNQSQNPYGSGREGFPAIGPSYVEYLRGLAHFDLGKMPVANEPISSALAKAGVASLGLLLVAFILSLALGLLLGFRAGAHHAETRGVSSWLIPITTVGLAMPGFYIGTLFVAASLVYLLYAGPEAKAPLPVAGFGWDLHLVLPTVALMLRPTVQIARVTASQLSSELGKQYIVAARSRGNTWRRIQWRHALRNVLAPVILTTAGSLRLLVGELVLVERLFNWPGLGRLLVSALVLPQVAGPGTFQETALFLHPPLLAALLTIFTGLFIGVDMVASVLVRVFDPRLRAPEGEGPRG